MRLLVSVAAVFAFALSRPESPAPADGSGWPQWRMPAQNGISTETGLLKEWPASGPAIAWSMSGLGSGYGTVAIQADRKGVQGTQGSKGWPSWAYPVVCGGKLCIRNQGTLTSYTIQ